MKKGNFPALKDVKELGKFNSSWHSKDRTGKEKAIRAKASQKQLSIPESFDIESAIAAIDGVTTRKAEKVAVTVDTVAKSCKDFDFDQYATLIAKLQADMNEKKAEAIAEKKAKAKQLMEEAKALEQGK